MNFDDLIEKVKELPEADIPKLAAYLSHLKRLRDPEIVEKLKRRNADRGTDAMMTPDEFEAHLNSI